jgi:hypothetical protein
MTRKVTFLCRPWPIEMLRLMAALVQLQNAAICRRKKEVRSRYGGLAMFERRK